MIKASGLYYDDEGSNPRPGMDILCGFNYIYLYKNVYLSWLIAVVTKAINNKYIIKLYI